jgi:hypothetical protein
LRARKAPRKATVGRFPRIRVIEKPGADYAPPAHDLDDPDCWCGPQLEWFGEDVYLVAHRLFEN